MVVLIFNDCIKTKEAQGMLNENIRNLRKSKGLSQEELAIRLNVVKWSCFCGIGSYRKRKLRC